MFPGIGETAKFVFVSRFSSLNGIYKVLSENTLDEVLDLEGSIVSTVYEACGLTEEDYQTDYPDFRYDTIYKLEHVTTENIIYIPSSFNDLIPDPNVKPYLQLGLGVNIGIFKDPTKIDWITNEIAQALEAVTGVTNVPTLFEIKTTWLSEAEYQSIDDARTVTIGEVSNYYTDNQKLITENTRLKTIIAAYENTFKILSGG